MNNSKKLPTKKVKKDRLIEQKPITKISKLWIIVSAVVIIAIVGGLLFDEYYESPIMKIDGKNYTMSDMSYYFYQVESTYEDYDQMFGGGGAYWDTIYNQDTGETVRDVAKQEALDNAQQAEIVYKEAVSEGYKLTAEEKKTVSDNVDTLLNSTISKTVIKKNNFTKEYLTGILNKLTLDERYRKDKIATFNIDEAAIKAGVKYEDYRQYNIQYLFISTKTTDKDDNSVDMTADQKKAAYNKISTAYSKVKTTTDWSTLIAKDEKELTYQDTHFIPTDTSYSEDMMKMMEGMNNGDISNIYEDESGYYIVRMVNNNAPDSYDQAVKDAISKAESEAFADYYKGLLEKHKYSTNEKALKSLTMGSITL